PPPATCWPGGCRPCSASRRWLASFPAWPGCTFPTTSPLPPAPPSCSLPPRVLAWHGLSHAHAAVDVKHQAACCHFEAGCCQFGPASGRRALGGLVGG